MHNLFHRSIINKKLYKLVGSSKPEAIKMRKNKEHSRKSGEKKVKNRGEAFKKDLLSILFDKIYHPEVRLIEKLMI